VLLLKAEASSSYISVLGRHKHLYNYMMNWTSRKYLFIKKGIFQPDPPLIHLTMQQQLC